MPCGTCENWFWMLLWYQWGREEQLGTSEMVDIPSAQVMGSR